VTKLYQGGEELELLLLGLELLDLGVAVGFEPLESLVDLAGEGRLAGGIDLVRHLVEGVLQGGDIVLERFLVLVSLSVFASCLWTLRSSGTDRYRAPIFVIVTMDIGTGADFCHRYLCLLREHRDCGHGC
jgi:hypothetical protein